ncbi:hypothetical protein TNIN_422731 [Trichonephila inaurata madagascariensis]|uniref:Uncharacterized protein n=1 Tax=Trichonephila inaurata madagascariensis TaxID=2747483 RepID=A0A8X6XH85_9ARAC|nr:hypothetical protein TNIN_422731 [Trichonephila inaurata madagascariensis]
MGKRSVLQKSVLTFTTPYYFLLSGISAISLLLRIHCFAKLTSVSACKGLLKDLHEQPNGTYDIAHTDESYFCLHPLNG